MPKHSLLPGSELTKELYRWDQRLYTLQLKIPGFAQPAGEKRMTVLQEDVALSTLCDKTGGIIFCRKILRMKIIICTHIAKLLCFVVIHR